MCKHIIKVKSQILYLSLIVLLIGSCQKDDMAFEPKLSIVGEWKYEFEILSDGTKLFDNPYALLEFEYSDGFILKENGIGNPQWFNTINGDFEWLYDDFKLTISVTRSDNSIDQFEYIISNLTNSSMEFKTPKGHKYLMIKQ